MANGQSVGDRLGKGEKFSTSCEVMKVAEAVSTHWLKEILEDIYIIAHGLIFTGRSLLDCQWHALVPYALMPCDVHTEQELPSLLPLHIFQRANLCNSWECPFCLDGCLMGLEGSCPPGNLRQPNNPVREKGQKITDGMSCKCFLHCDFICTVRPQPALWAEVHGNLPRGLFGFWSDHMWS